MAQNDLHTRETLLARIQKDQNDVNWDEFSKYYSGYIYVVLNSYGLSAEDCEDLLQEVMLKLWKTLPEYTYKKGQCRFRSWLCILARNTALNFRNSKRNRNNSKNVDLQEAFDKLELFSDAEIEKISEKEWKSYISNMAWDNVKNELSDLLANVFEASINEDSNDVLAEQFSVSASSIRVYKMRARKALFKEIARLNTELGG